MRRWTGGTFVALLLSARSGDSTAAGRWIGTYIEGFLERHHQDISGRVLEVKDAYYTTRFGAARVTHADVIDVDTSNAAATIMADLTDGEGAIPSAAYDCFVLTQTLHIIYDIQAVLATAFRVLRPGGVLLCTVPCVSRISFEDGGLDNGDFWRFTEASIRRVMAEAFPVEAVEVTTHGNVLVCAAFLLGLDPGEVPAGALDDTDRAFPLICCVRAVKPPATSAASAEPPGLVLDARAVHARPSGAVLLYHRVGARQPDVHDLCVDVGVFREHMRHVRDECQPMALGDLVQAARQGRLPARAVAVTFDDGYLEHLTVVSPILVEYGIPATFYLNTDRFDLAHEAWWDLLERALLTGVPLPPTLDVHGDGALVRGTTTEAERRATHRALMEAAYPLPADARRALLDRVCDWSGLDLSPRPSHRTLTVDEAVRLSAQPDHHIGAHTVHHLCLPRQPYEVQVREMADCKVALQRALRQPVDNLAYPYGEYSRETVEAARVCGFARAVTVEPGVVGVGTERLLLPRLEIGPANAAAAPSLLSRAFAGASG